MNVSVFKSVVASCLFFGASAFLASHAQDETSEADQRVLDAVIVTGVQNDDAMAAFRAGEYAEAEIGFIDNARCALRAERNLSAAINSARTSSFRSDLDASQPNGTSNAPSNVAQQTKRTCDSRGFQVYMAGLSQIQLGKSDEAKRSFRKATVLSKMLYDAHYKLALMALLEGDTKTAEQQLKKVSGILRRCLRCPARQEILDRQVHLQKALNGDVTLH